MYLSPPVSSCVEDASSGTSHVVRDTENVHLCEKLWDDQTQPLTQFSEVLISKAVSVCILEGFYED